VAKVSHTGCCRHLGGAHHPCFQLSILNITVIKLANKSQILLDSGTEFPIYFHWTFANTGTSSLVVI